jgi:tRNA G18 (ribose-2'-O)-methylase SpoU
MDVLLYGVHRNLQRAYRTCAIFAVRRFVLWDCAAADPRPGALPAGVLPVFRVSSFEEFLREGAMCVALSPRARHSLEEVDWPEVTALLVGGETVGLPRGLPRTLPRRRIVTPRPWELTVEAALAIALYIRQRALDSARGFVRVDQTDQTDRTDQTGQTRWLRPTPPYRP